MTQQEAIKILEDYNKWRCDNSVPSIFKMPDPKEITKAVNFAIEFMKEPYLSKEKYREIFDEGVNASANDIIGRM